MYGGSGTSPSADAGRRRSHRRRRRGGPPPRSSPTSSRSVARRLSDGARRAPAGSAAPAPPSGAVGRRSSSSTSTAPPVALRSRSRAGMHPGVVDHQQIARADERRQVGHRAVAGRRVRAGVDQQAGRVAGLDRLLRDGRRAAGRSRGPTVLVTVGRGQPAESAASAARAEPASRRAPSGIARSSTSKALGVDVDDRRAGRAHPEPDVGAAARGRGTRRSPRPRRSAPSAPSVARGRCGLRARPRMTVDGPRVVHDRRGADQVVELPGGAERLDDRREERAQLGPRLPPSWRGPTARSEPRRRASVGMTLDASPAWIGAEGEVHPVAAVADSSARPVGRSTASLAAMCTRSTVRCGRAGVAAGALEPDVDEVGRRGDRARR